jgi:FixJ family two-component response regulator
MTDTEGGTVFVVDDDDAFRDSLVWLLEGHGYTVEAFADGLPFLARINGSGASIPPRRCVILDIRMPQLTGLQIQEQLQNAAVSVPILFVTAHGDVPMAVAAIKRGAFDFIEKPFPEALLIERVDAALNTSARVYVRAYELDATRKLLATLTAREQQIMALVLEGKLNKTIAYDLDISIKTVEAHRARVMEKLEVRSLAQLVQRVNAVSQADGAAS